MQKCTADGIYLYQYGNHVLRFMRISVYSCSFVAWFCSWVVQGQMKIVLYIILFFFLTGSGVNKAVAMMKIGKTMRLICILNATKRSL